MARDSSSRGPTVPRGHSLGSTWALSIAWTATIAALGAASAAVAPFDPEPALPASKALVDDLGGASMSPQAQPPIVLVVASAPSVTNASSAPSASKAPNVRVGDRWYRASRTLRMRVTAYSPDERSCGKFADGITASGRPVTTNGGRLVAADTTLLPFGTMVSVPGYSGGRPVPVLDRGGAIKGHRLDVLFTTHERAMRWGVQHLDVTIWEEVGKKGEVSRAPRR